jgi:hypothetical protein
MSLCSRVVCPEQNRVTVPDPFEVKGSIGGNEGPCLDSVMSQPSVLHARGVAVWFLFGGHQQWRGPEAATPSGEEREEDRDAVSENELRIL